MKAITKIKKRTGAPWRFSMVGIFLGLYFLPSALGGGVGPYSFTVLGPVFLLLFGLFLLRRPGFNLQIRGVGAVAYFLGLPVLAGIWTGVLGSTNALIELVHLTLGAVTILLTMWLFRDASDIHSLVRVAKIGGGILAVWALSEYFFGVERPPTAGWGNPNYLTTYFALITPILWVEVLGLVGHPRWTSVLLLSLLVLVTILAESRANLLAMVIQGGIVSWQRLADMSGFRSYILRAVFVLLLVGVGGGVVQGILSEGGKKEGNLTAQIAKGRGSEFVRAIMIYDGLRLFWESRGIGVGAGNVTYAESSQPDFGQSNPDDTIYPLHNFPVQLAAQYGIPGLFLFGVSYLSIFSSLYRRKISISPKSRCDYDTVEIVRKSGYSFLISFVLISISVSYIFDRRPFYMIFGIYTCVNQYLIKHSIET
ncbi:O-antigen ligase family protein [Salinibacter ruber]|jgi:hypothetical protein|uniref:O-antigen ligase family protein n=1 Tax=Salinibacter ruber TaxID=146919 RepID=UPI0021689A3D|nr:O-antigen ligase family protein [Salinibacter ruber]MCS4149395.1 hypothetical protein [Salinibacter ruber]